MINRIERPLANDHPDGSFSVHLFLHRPKTQNLRIIGQYTHNLLGIKTLSFALLHFTFSKRNSLPPLFHWLAPLFKIYPLRGVYAAGWMQLDANCFYFAVRANWFQRQQGNQNIYPGNKKNLQVCFCNFAIFLTSTQDLMKTQWPGSDKNNKEAIEKARLISPSGLKPTCEIQEIVFYKKKRPI